MIWQPVRLNSHAGMWRPLCLAAVCLSQPLCARENAQLLDEISELRAQHDAQRKALEAVERRLSVLEAQLQSESAPQVQQIAAQELLSKADISAYTPKFSGDARLRYENNTNPNGRDRGRFSYRLRLAARYDLDDNILIGARVTTGDQSDPNSSDVTLSDFADDFEISLDQAYIAASFEGTTFWGGRFPNPFRRTDVVWDGDINPQGLAAQADITLADQAKLRLASLYYVIDEQVAAPDSDMVGGQAVLTLGLAPAMELSLAAGYYDYSLGSLAGADEGDLRTNLRSANGGYQSDFNILDLLATLEFGQRVGAWPVRFSGEYVRNLNAANEEATGLGFSASVGELSRRGNWRVGYSFNWVEADAVLAAFAQDNIPFGTNYRAHVFVAETQVTDRITLGASVHHYQPLTTRSTAMPSQLPWSQRFRLEAVAQF